ncbi:porin family protein [Mucilaginibacter sp. SJ]|uniref:porin family protein n=1 Tax=Mucilaginibacter sp. SJ TaxID=3029053 RepID=UPI0023A9FC40|nr:porin family protein [Mucilaginibacter sp. SJ]WEA00641.1 porin family protein [Mucilaginibacter sp. SJ]
MKKIILALTISVAGLTSAKAQTVDIIPKAGISITTQSASALQGEKSTAGFTGGIAFDIHAGKSGFSFQPEINYVSKGTKLKNVSKAYNFNYLELPFLAKYSFNMFYVDAGPSIAMQLGGKDKFTQLYGSKPRNIDFGVQMGAGLALPVGTGKFILDGRYSLGLTDQSKGAGTVKNRGVYATIGYAIPL